VVEAKLSSVGLLVELLEGWVNDGIRFEPDIEPYVLESMLLLLVLSQGKSSEI
jgi:hypothetical protein